MSRPSLPPSVGILTVLLIPLFFCCSDRARAGADAWSDGSAERLERRLAAKQGRLRLPLPRTPDTETPLSRLRMAGIGLGAPMLIRIFKAESELEVWYARDGAYMHFATYPVCFWSGKLGPKLREGDKQSPEGFYTIGSEQLHSGGRWRRSLDIGFPNVFDRVNGRTGSLILVHGGCDSVGCFAMTNPVNAEIYDLVSATLRVSEGPVPVHVFPFRMSDENIARHANALWKDFWGDLKLGYDSFERTRLPPRISVCRKRYLVQDASPGGAMNASLELCSEDALAFGAQGSEKPKVNVGKGASVPHQCSMARASCRRWVALRQRPASGKVAAKVKTSHPRDIKVR